MVLLVDKALLFALAAELRLFEELALLLKDDELGKTTPSPSLDLAIELNELFDMAVLLVVDELDSFSAESFPIDTTLLALLPRLVWRDDDAKDEALLETATELLSVFCTAALDDLSVDKLTLSPLPPPPHPVRRTSVNRLVDSHGKLLFLVYIM